jgi:hypothetical protein
MKIRLPSSGIMKPLFNRKLSRTHGQIVMSMDCASVRYAK